jgi:hypothetical protein
MMAK